MSLWKMRKDIFKFDSFGEKVYRIEAKEDFTWKRMFHLPKEIKKGELGGWISRKSNLDENLWLNESVSVSGKSYIDEYFELENVEIGGNVKISSDRGIIKNSIFEGDIRLFGPIAINHSSIKGNNIQISGTIQMTGVSIFDRNGFDIDGDIFINQFNCKFKTFKGCGPRVTVYKTLGGLLRFNCEAISGVSYEDFISINETRLKNWPWKDKHIAKELIEFGKMIKNTWR